MRKYTTVTVDRELLRVLESLKCELGAKSLNDVIWALVTEMRMRRAREFVDAVLKAREEGNLRDLRGTIEKLRSMKWMKSS